MFSLREYREPTSRLPDYLPWAGVIAPGVVLQKDGILQQTIAFRGPDLASSSDAELVTKTAQLNNALRRLGSGWAFFVEAQRFASSYYPDTKWPAPAAELVNNERRRAFEAEGNHFESNYYFTFVQQLPSARQNKIVSIFFETPDHNSPETNLRDLQRFQKTVNDITDIMRGVFVDVGPLDSDQTLSYLHSTISTNRHPVRMPETPMFLDALLPDMALTPGDIPMLGDYFMPTCTIAGFPATSLPGILDALNHLQCEYRWVSRHIALDAQDARKEIESYRKQWWAKRKTLFTLFKEQASGSESALVDNAAANKSADADAALQELGEDLLSFGYFTSTITVWDKDLDLARKKIAAVRQIVNSQGFTARDETLQSLQAWLGSLPGHVYANVRRPLMSSLNVAHMMPLSAVWAGDDTNEHLERECGVGTPHIMCKTTGGTPFRLNLNVQDLGHTKVIGPPGSGKSAFLATIALGWLQYPNAQVIIFDKDRSARAATLAVGGAIYEPGLTESLNACAFQPLGNIDKTEERIWASQFILTLLALQNITESPRIKSAVDLTLQNLAAAPRDQRTLTLCADILGSHIPDLKEALRPYTIEGNFGFIFDAKHDDLGNSFWTMVETGALMGKGEQAILPALLYLFRRFEQRFDGRPTLLILDEAWLFLGHPVFAAKIGDWLRTLRKKNVYVVLATQNLDELMADGREGLRNTIANPNTIATDIYLPNAKARDPNVAAVYDQFGLTPVELDILANATEKRDYYFRNPKGRRLFSLGLGPAALAFVGASSQNDHQAMNRIIASHPPSEHAKQLLLRRRLEKATEELEQITASYETQERTTA